MSKNQENKEIIQKYPKFLQIRLGMLQTIKIFRNPKNIDLSKNKGHNIYIIKATDKHKTHYSFFRTFWKEQLESERNFGNFFNLLFKIQIPETGIL